MCIVGTHTVRADYRNSTPEQGDLSRNCNSLDLSLAAILAYYSIQMGILFLTGPLRLTEVLVSFLIAAVQLALFLWPTHVLGVEWRTSEAEFKELRQRPLFGLFAFAGPFANWYDVTSAKA